MWTPQIWTASPRSSTRLAACRVAGGASGLPSARDAVTLNVAGANSASQASAYGNAGVRAAEHDAAKPPRILTETEVETQLIAPPEMKSTPVLDHVPAGIPGAAKVAPWPPLSAASATGGSGAAPAPYPAYGTPGSNYASASSVATGSPQGASDVPYPAGPNAGGAYGKSNLQPDSASAYPLATSVSSSSFGAHPPSESGAPSPHAAAPQQAQVSYPPYDQAQHQQQASSIMSAAVPAPFGSQMGSQAPAAAPQQSASGRLHDDLRRVILQLASVEEVTSMVNGMLASQAVGASELEAAFRGVLFSDAEVGARADRNLTILPLIDVLCGIERGVQTQLKESLLRTCLNELSKDRAIDVDRFEIFAYADCFASFCFFGVVPLSAAIKTCLSMLQYTQRRSAAVTSLGKIVELCGDTIVQQLDAALMQQLLSTMHGIQDPELAYDVEYIVGNLRV
ncbi:hypothetical protein FVE85_7797 [Porphyridium purpureum]|uniref:Uncharacterized protein n=1 Tax=Porphyridium purpureum TaxID=35688 RepID=A0A5J4YIT7_PORPP|nr:hypothetical protein FVE85_7797 [Porphyridium purpureum]|eukprot:POR4373..scf210_14